MIRAVQTNFTSGMLDPTLQDHVDLQVYRNGARRIVNCRLLPQGGATRRSGTQAVAALSKPDYQIEGFIFSDDQAYAFLFYDGGVEIWDKITRTYLTFIVGPWTAAHIASGQLRAEQQLDKMIVSHGDFETRVITRVGFASFTIDTFRWSADGNTGISFQPYHKYAAGSVSMRVSSPEVGPAQAEMSNPHFVPGHVGLKFRYRKKQLTVVNYISPTLVDVTVDEKLYFTSGGGLVADHDYDYDWDEQAFSPIRGYARCFCLHLQRLWVGGGRDAPNTVWGTSLDDPFSMNLGTGADDDAIKYTIYSRRVASIVSMVSNVYLQIFTTHGEFYVPKPDSNALTPATFSIELQSGYGCNQLQAKQFDQNTIFVTRKALGLREFIYDAVQASYSSDALTFMSKQLLTGPIDLDVQMEGEGEEQESRAYISNVDGTIAVLSKVKKENIAGWSYWTTQGKFQRLGVIDSEVWATVQRTINGITKTYLEVFDNRHRMDFATDMSGSSSVVWGPFNLHKGAVVHVVSDSLYLGEFLVDATTGMITLPLAVSSVEIGFNVVPKIIPLQQHVQMPDGITIGEPKRYVSVAAQLVDTVSCQIKNRVLSLEDQGSDPGVAPEPYTGDFHVFLLGWGIRNSVTIQAPLPLPFTINSLMTELEV